jgi:outer membrane protein
MCGDSLPPPKHIRLASYRLKAAVGQLTAPELNLPVDVYDSDAYYQAVRNRLFGLGR